MTQFNAPDNVPVHSPLQPVGRPIDPRMQKTSGMAIASLVLGLLFCVPFLAPALGLVFGIIALVVIGKSQGRLKGKGMAIAGLIASVVMLVLHGVVVVILVLGVQVFPDLAVAFVQAVEQEDYSKARTMLSVDIRDDITDEQLSELRQYLAGEYGDVRSASFDIRARVYQSNTAMPTSRQPGVSPMPVKFEFAVGSVYGEVEAAMLPGPDPRIKSLTFLGDSGLWVFPDDAQPEFDDSSDNRVPDEIDIPQD